MHTPRPLHNNVNESVVVVTSGLNSNRSISFPVNVIRSIFNGFLDWYMSAIYRSNTLGESMKEIELAN